MKYSMVVFIIICCILESTGQIQHRDLMVAVSGSYSQTKSQTGFVGGTIGSVSGNSFTITPDVGYFLSNAFAVRSFLNYGRSFSRVESAPIYTETTLTSIALGLSARYYVPLTNRVYLFPQLGYQFQHSIAKFDGSLSAPDRNQSNWFGIGSLGILYFLAEQIGVEIVGDYNINFEDRLQFKLGFRYVLRKKDTAVKLLGYD